MCLSALTDSMYSDWPKKHTTAAAATLWYSHNVITWVQINRRHRNRGTVKGSRKTTVWLGKEGNIT